MKLPDTNVLLIPPAPKIHGYTTEQMLAWGKECAAAEREECAKVCESEWSNVAEEMYGKEIGAAIRARGTK